MSEVQVVCRVGYALNPKKLRMAKHADNLNDKETLYSQTETKDTLNPQGEERGVGSEKLAAPWCGGGLATIVGLNTLASEAEVDGVVFYPLNLHSEFHVILHKLTEDLDADIEDSSGANGIGSSRKLRDVESYLQQHPDVAIVDPLESVRNVINREKTCLCLRRVQERLRERCPFMQPDFAVINEQDLFTLSGSRSAAITTAMISHNMTFPVICKPVKACGTAESHKMTIVFSNEGFSALTGPFLMQRFHDHGAVFYKVYVLEREVLITPRRSLPNLERAMHDLLSAGMHCLSFDSRVDFPSLPDCCTDTTEQGNSCSMQDNGDAASIDAALHAQLVLAASEISLEFGLSLYGFDVIVPLDRPADILVVDVNYFPSYKNVPDFPAKLRAHLRHAARLPAWQQPTAMAPTSTAVPGL